MRDNTITRREKLNMLQTEELDRMLQQELRKETPDEEVVLPILDVLRDRDTCTTVEIDDTASVAWEKFQNTQMITEEKLQKKERKTSFRRKIAVLAVAACLVVVVIPVAFGKEGFFSAVAQWTDRVFSFSKSEDMRQNEYVFETDNPGLQQVYDAVVALGVTHPVVPMWLPEVYELTEIKKASFPFGNKITAMFSDGETSIVLVYSLYLQGEIHYEKISEDAELCEFEDRNHYFVRNKDTYTVMWVSDKAECSITAPLNKDVIIRIVGSIYWRDFE